VWNHLVKVERRLVQHRLPQSGPVHDHGRVWANYWKLDAFGSSHKGVTATKKLVVKFWTCNNNGVCWD
jgi:hypothetical protein